MFPDFDAFFAGFDRAALEEHAQRAFENLFARSREARHLLGGAVVVQGQESAVVADQLEQHLRRVLHLCESRLLEAHVDAVVLGDTPNVTFQPVADGHGTEDLVAVDHAPVAVVDDHAEADFALRGHQQRDLLAGFHRDQVVVYETLEFGRGHAAARDVVFVEVDDVAVSGQDAALLVAVGEEQVLAVQSPVEESPVGRLVHHAQIARFAFAQQRRFGRRHEAVLRVVVEEDLFPVADLVRQRSVAVGEQHFVLLLVGEV